MTGLWAVVRGLLVAWATLATFIPICRTPDCVWRWRRRSRPLPLGAVGVAATAHAGGVRHALSRRCRLVYRDPALARSFMAAGGRRYAARVHRGRPGAPHRTAQFRLSLA